MKFIKRWDTKGMTGKLFLEEIVVAENCVLKAAASKVDLIIVGDKGRNTLFFTCRKRY
jgi:hypothetical protein